MTSRYANKPHVFYVTLPSTASADEFPENKANSFKVRLPQRLELQGPHWHVALSGASIPDTTDTILGRLGYHDLDLPDIEKIADHELPNRDLFSILAITVDKKAKLLTSAPTRIKYKDVKEFTAPTGEAFMISVTNYIMAGFAYMLNRVNKKLVGTAVDANGKPLRCVPTFRDERHGDQACVFMDNSKLTLVSETHRPLLSIRTDLALKMGWLKCGGHPATECWGLGPNLMPLDNDGVLSGGKEYTHGFLDPLGNVLMFVVRNNMMTLSPNVSWCFNNLNAAYDALRGSPRRTLMVYSDVAASSIVGGQITDLLREIPYSREEKGDMNIEPLHRHFQRIRSNIIETIEVHISEQDGQLVKFDSDKGSMITLAFRNDIP